MKIDKAVEKQKKFFLSNATRDIEFRIQSLLKLKQELEENESKLFKAIEKDLGKTPFETYMTEIGMVYQEIKEAVRHVKRWAKPKRVRTSIAQFPAKCKIVPEPYGVVAIFSPWNYPILLTLTPLIGAISAGNCVILKLSEKSVNTSKIMKTIIKKCFDEKHVIAFNGEVEESKEILEQDLDYIFFTGSTKTGKEIMQKAAEKLIPVTLELGGKSPCIIDETADLKLAAKRIIFGKLLNAGQTCVAPDYILIQEDKKEKFIEECKQVIEKFLGTTPIENKDYPNIINDQQYERLKNMLKEGNILVGGGVEDSTRKIELTLLEDVDENSMVMQEEIFGPILPVMTFKTISEIWQNISKFEKPLALYLFTKDKKVRDHIMQEIPFGGGCVNDTILHLANPKMPFGGVGKSGIGAYHGKYTFITFSHQKTILEKTKFLDIPLRYYPYTSKKLENLKKILK